MYALKCRVRLSAAGAAPNGRTMADLRAVYERRRRHAPSDAEYVQRVREILAGEPSTGVERNPTRLLPHVYIGCQDNAENLRLLRRLGITHVLNCAGFKGPRPYPETSPYAGYAIDYHEFKADDDDCYDISRHFNEAFRFLDGAKRQGGTALVHCAMGINRSAATCVAYMMADAHMPLLDAVRTIKRKRSVTLCNRGFQQQLVRFARSRGMLGNSLGDDRVVQENLRLNNQWYANRKQQSATNRYALDDRGLLRRSASMERHVAPDRLASGDRRYSTSGTTTSGTAMLCGRRCNFDERIRSRYSTNSARDERPVNGDVYDFTRMFNLLRK